VNRPATQVLGVGHVDLLMESYGEPPFGDVRDVLLASKHWGDPGHGYAMSDIFTVRHRLIRELAPKSVFEFGALVGYFLMTALDAAPSIERIGWIDTEKDCPESNRICLENLQDYLHTHDRGGDIFFAEQTRRCLEFRQADLVQVDAAHSYPDCLTDLIWAMELSPQTIFVDDYMAIDGVKRATDEFAAWQGLEVEYHPTVNGLAVLRI